MDLDNAPSHTSSDAIMGEPNDLQLGSVQDALIMQSSSPRAPEALITISDHATPIDDEDHDEMIASQLLDTEREANAAKVLAVSEASLFVDSNDVTQDNTDLEEQEQGYATRQTRAGTLVEEFEIVRGRVPKTNIEVALPPLALAEKAGYAMVHSDVIENVLGETRSRSARRKYYEVEFTDGRSQLLSEDVFNAYVEGDRTVIQQHQETTRRAGSMAQPSRKRKRGSRWDESSSESGYSSRSEATADEEVENDSDEHPSSRRTYRQANSSKPAPKRLRQTTTRTSARIQIADSDDESMPDDTPEIVFRSRSASQRPTRGQAQESTSRPTRSLRPRAQRPIDDADELSIDAGRASDDDGTFAFVTSDVATPKGRPRKGTVRPRLRQVTLRKSVARARSPDSDIEFEEPKRRSSRANKSKASMRDDADMDEESFYVAGDVGSGVPKVVSVREVFQPPEPGTPFTATHIPKCHVCGGSKQKGQLVGCQGCTLSYHRACLGTRSAREHLVTKVGEDEFVLQCKFCIGTYRKKDPLAPNHAMCQSCHQDGATCDPFSKRLTSRQEEKLREQNDGVDPITSVSPDLINNALKVLFRCKDCHRAWHIEHLPPARNSEVSTDLREERLKDYSVDWQCNECNGARYKIDKLVAWRPTSVELATSQGILTFFDVPDDEKELLVKWESKSYAHCTWMPGAWVFGVAAGAMRMSFGKHDAHTSRLSLTDDTAYPEEYLLPDIILRAKFKDGTHLAKSKTAELANIDKVSKIYVKFQGLSYAEAVWDAPPKPDNAERWKAFEDAYREYVQGRYFASQSMVRTRERVKAFREDPFEEVESQPTGLKRGNLMQYQLEGLNWLLENFHASKSVVLADEMGLGKTIQVISLVTSLVLDHPKCWPFLIVVPNATCPNWRREFKQWSPDVRCVTYHGGREPQDLAYKYELFPDGSKDMKAHVVIMSYDSAQDPNTKTKFSSVRWMGLVVDEGQRLKNDTNLLYLALQAMRIPFRLLLTGTPLQNNKRELFNLLQFIDSSQDAEKLDEEYAVLDKDTLPKLHEMIRPYFLRRTKLGVLKFLPPIAQIILPVTMTVLQEKVSKGIIAKNPELIKAVLGKGKLHKKERGSLSNILMQLRKCLCHPFIYSGAIEEKHHEPEVLHRNLVEASAKLILLQVMLPRLKERGHRVLIFSQFLGQLDIVEDFLSGLGYGFRRLDGTMSSLEKQKRIDAFNAPDSELFAFLLSTRAGGVGINLATADTVIIMDPDFNPHQDLQALSRAHRIGQKKKVLCFQLVTKDSVEERIMQIGRKKMALDHALIESMDDAELVGDDLESILKHGTQALFDEHYQKEAIHYDVAAIDSLLDRSEIEETKTNEEGSADAQYSQARVWSKNKSGFEANLGTEEDKAPEPITSSVWDSIIAEREAEAERDAELNKETLGRGGRRRKAVNYKTNAILPELALAEDGADSSDATDVFEEGNETAEDSDNGTPEPPGREEEPLSQAPRTENNTKSQRRKVAGRKQTSSNQLLPVDGATSQSDAQPAAVPEAGLQPPLQAQSRPSQHKWHAQPTNGDDPRLKSFLWSSHPVTGPYNPGVNGHASLNNAVNTPHGHPEPAPASGMSYPGIPYSSSNGHLPFLGGPQHPGQPAAVNTHGWPVLPSLLDDPAIESFLATQKGQQPSEAALRLAIDNIQRFPGPVEPGLGHKQALALHELLRAPYCGKK